MDLRPAIEKVRQMEGRATTRAPLIELRKTCQPTLALLSAMWEEIEASRKAILKSGDIDMDRASKRPDLWAILGSKQSATDSAVRAFCEAVGK